MSVLDRLGLQHKKKKEVKMNYLQKQEMIRAQKRKNKVDVTKTSKPTTARECPVCRQKMNVATGQLMFCHRECRGKMRRIMRKQGIK